MCRSCIVARMAAAGVILLGAIVLLGWSLGLESLKRIDVSWVAMNPATAVGFMLCGGALLALARPPGDEAGLRAGTLSVAITFGMGALCMLRDLTGLDLSLDRLLFTPRLDEGHAIPNRMAPNTAACFVLAAVALHAARSSVGWRFRLGAGAALVTGTISILALIGYANGVAALSAIGPAIPMAVHTAGGFLLLAAGTLVQMHGRVIHRLHPAGPHCVPDSRRASGAVQRHATIGFAGAAIVMSVIGTAAFLSLWHFLEDSHRDEQSRQIILRLEALGSAIRETEMARRGAGSAGSAPHPWPDERSLDAVHDRVAEVRSLAAGRPALLADLDRVESLIAAELPRSGTRTGVHPMHGVEASRPTADGSNGASALDDLRGAVQAMIRHEESALAARMVRRASGARTTVSIIAVGSVLGIGFVVFAGWVIRRDISGRLAAEYALRETQRQIGFLADAMPQVVWTANPDGRIVYYNSHWEAYSGLSVHETVAGGWAALLHPDDHDRTLAQWTVCLRTGDVHEIEHRFRRGSDGMYRWHLTRAIPRRDESGRIVEWVGTSTDIHDRRTGEERIRDLYDNAPCGYHSLDADGMFVEINSTELAWLGYEREEVVGVLHVTAVLTPESAERFRSGFPGFLDRGEAHGLEFEMLRRDGSTFPVLLNATALRDAEGRFLRTRSTLFDITERRRVERQYREARDAAEAASRAKSEFLAHMSHEIRTPLNGIVGMTELLLASDLTEQQRRYGMLARTSAQSLTSVINDILDFSKIEAGRLEIVPGDFNFHHALEDVVEMLAPSAARKGVELACQVHADVPMLVRTDSDRLRQILVNLVHNAIKFTDTGAIRVRATRERAAQDGVTIRVTVSDSGIGIPADRIDRLFKAFSQADASTTRHYGGTGLGLAISKKLVEMLGGEIGVVSEAGRGSTFWFTLPVIGITDREEETSPARPDPASLRVLVVDDSAFQREVLLEHITSWGMAGDTVAACADVLDRLRSAAASGAPFHVVLIDHEMPGTDACEMAEAIREHRDVGAPALILLLPPDADPQVKHLDAMGFSGSMSKPVRQSQLFDGIVSAMSRRSAAGASMTAEEPAPVVRPVAAPPPQRASIGRVLVAEDNEINQVIATEMLTAAGYSVDVVADGEAAVAAAQSAPYDLILMDCQMPKMDGFDATREIRRLEQAGRIHSMRAGAAGRIPIVALTANAMKGDRERCLEAGMDGYASKPIRPADLLNTIEGAIRRDRPGASAA